MPNDERLTVNIKTAAAMLGISKNLAYSLAKRGQLPGALRLGQKRIVVSRAQLENLLRGEVKNGEQ
jgi:predicted DNA-binding transcriptional regulator AlpA